MDTEMEKGEERWESASVNICTQTKDISTSQATPDTPDRSDQESPTRTRHQTMQSYTANYEKPRHWLLN